MRHHEALPVIVAPTHQDLWLKRIVADKVVIMGYLNSVLSDQLMNCVWNLQVIRSKVRDA
jgi:hypothetical protein